MYITLSIVIVLLFLIWKFGSYNHGYFNKLGVNGPRPWPFLGTLPLMLWHGVHYVDRILLDRYGYICGTYFGSVPFLVTSDKELIRQVCIKESHLFTDRFSFGIEGYPLKSGVTVLKGSEWKRVRNLLTPTFTAGKLKKMIPLIQKNVESLKCKFLQAADKQEDIDVKSYFTGLAMDVIASTMFGIDINSQNEPNHPFYGHAKNIFKFSFANPFLILLMFWPGAAKYVQRLMPNGFLPKETVQYFVDAIYASIEERKKNPKDHHDFLALMLKAREDNEKHSQETMPVAATSEDIQTKENEIASKKWESLGNTRGIGLSEDELVAQSFIFLVAGFETTASSLQFCAYFLAMNPDCQERCRQEIQDALDNEMPSYDNVNKLKFLGQCIYESMRIFSPAFRFDRVATQDVKLTDSHGREYFIPKGLTVVIPSQAIHLDPLIYEDPETFDPDRFSSDKLDYHKSEYELMPFGLGPRNCIGMRFALLEMKVALATLLSTVRFVKCQKTCAKPQIEVFGGFKLKEPIVLRAEKLLSN